MQNNITLPESALLGIMGERDALRAELANFQAFHRSMLEEMLKRASSQASEDLLRADLAFLKSCGIRTEVEE